MTIPESSRPEHKAKLQPTISASWNLPESNSIRWVVRRKIEVLTAIRQGFFTAEEACQRYAISMDELFAWQTAMRHFGPEGLCATHVLRMHGVEFPERSVD
ncbi:MAG: DUF1153 domain-containing protein [Nitrosospira sp.]